jgi:hypothetical protein
VQQLPPLANLARYDEKGRRPTPACFFARERLNVQLVPTLCVGTKNRPLPRHG